MLVSVLNLKLRDYYGSFTELCEEEDLPEEELTETLRANGYRYDALTNSIRPIA